MLFDSKSYTSPKYFSENANLTLEKLNLLKDSFSENSEECWAKLALENLTWTKPFDTTLEWKPPFARWFLGGVLNASVQCLDRHLNSLTAKKVALVWEGEPVLENCHLPRERREFTYEELHNEVCQVAYGLAQIGVKKGEIVAIYMPMIPEAVMIMLACARLGATHSVVFGGFSADALRDRIADANARFVVTANAGYRRGKCIPLKSAVDAAVKQCPSVETVVVVDRLGMSGEGFYVSDAKQKSDETVPAVCWDEKKDIWYHNLKNGHLASPVDVDSNHPLFVLYTSGTTGKPKGILHSTAGYLLWANLTCQWVLDLKPTDTFWCTADIGWVTGHTYVVYGPLSAGATVFIYEGAPDFPNYERTWNSIEREKVSIFYTAPTAIRSYMRQGDAFVENKNLSSLRLLGSVGEPINPEAWLWYRKVIGKNKCPIVDTWWQTETGGILMSPLPGITAQKPGAAMQPLPGIEVDVVNENGESVALGISGKLVIKKPWPSQLLNVFGAPERYKETYWSDFYGKKGPAAEPFYFSGDGAHKDEDGDIWIIGRVDDVINIAGHRIGTMELESALVGHSHVAEAAVVGVPDELKGTTIFAFVTLKNDFREVSKSKDWRNNIVAKLREHVTQEIGSFAKPEFIRFTEALPKTRSGKIMRRLLRNIAIGHESVGDTSTLEDVSVLANFAGMQED